MDELCEPGGIRLKPGTEDLQRFIDVAGSLNGLKIALKLQEKIVN